VGLPYFAHPADTNPRDEFVRSDRVASGPFHGTIVSGMKSAARRRQARRLRRVSARSQQSPR
jgi:hypothetical protein